MHLWILVLFGKTPINSITAWIRTFSPKFPNLSCKECIKNVNGSTGVPFMIPPWTMAWGGICRATSFAAPRSCNITLAAFLDGSKSEAIDHNKISLLHDLKAYWGSISGPQAFGVRRALLDVWGIIQPRKVATITTPTIPPNRVLWMAIRDMMDDSAPAVGLGDSLGIKLVGSGSWAATMVAKHDKKQNSTTTTARVRLADIMMDADSDMSRNSWQPWESKCVRIGCVAHAHAKSNADEHPFLRLISVSKLEFQTSGEKAMWHVCSEMSKSSPRSETSKTEFGACLNLNTYKLEIFYLS